MPKIDGDVLASLQRDALHVAAVQAAVEKAIDADVIRRLVRDALLRAARHRSAEVAVEYVTEAMIHHLTTLGPIYARAPEQLPPEHAPAEAEGRAQAADAQQRSGADA